MPTRARINMSGGAGPLHQPGHGDGNLPFEVAQAISHQLQIALDAAEQRLVEASQVEQARAQAAPYSLLSPCLSSQSLAS